MTIKSIIALSAAMIAACSCNDVLNVESKTAVTSEFLYSTPEGLEKAIVGLYDMERSLVFEQNVTGVGVLLDASTDIVVFRGGTTASLFRLDNNNASTSYFKSYWQSFYNIIGKANEIIAGAKNQDLENPTVQRILGEASLFRARAYFILYQRYERLYLNSEPTTVENAFGRTFRAAGRSEIFELIDKDLDVAIQYLAWKTEPGRMTKAIAKHVRAQVAMWEEDWDRAIAECEDLFGPEASAFYSLESVDKVFTGENLNHKEALYTFQYSRNIGGGGSVSGGVVTGHRLSLITTPNYNKIQGMKWSSENGGYGWGRVYPNSYLFSLYDQATDNRYKNWFKFNYTYNDEANLPSGTHVGDPITFTTSQYLESAHPMSLKYFDRWTNIDEPGRTSSYKDVIVYRLAETALLASEAYFHKEGSSAKAVEYFNKTWTRAGNAPKSSITLEDIIEENARELHLEGNRWGFLKRLGLLGERVRLHNGDKKTDDPNLNSDYCQARTNFNDTRDWRWPVPQDELDLMPGFGQNAGWL